MNNLGSFQMSEQKTNKKKNKKNYIAPWCSLVMYIYFDKCSGGLDNSMKRYEQLKVVSKVWAKRDQKCTPKNLLALFQNTFLSWFESSYELQNWHKNWWEQFWPINIYGASFIPFLMADLGQIWVGVLLRGVLIGDAIRLGGVCVFNEAHCEILETIFPRK